jgi:hypothetical protein
MVRKGGGGGALHMVASMVVDSVMPVKQHQVVSQVSRMPWLVESACPCRHTILHAILADASRQRQAQGLLHVEPSHTCMPSAMLCLPFFYAVHMMNS